MAGAAAATMPADGQHCPYCPQGESTPAITDHAGACAFPHQPQVDGRASALFVAIPARHSRPVVGLVGGGDRAPAIALPEPVPRVPLALSYCRFLELRLSRPTSAKDAFEVPQPGRLSHGTGISGDLNKAG